MTYQCPICARNHPDGETHRNAATRLTIAADRAEALGELFLATNLRRTLRDMAGAEHDYHKLHPTEGNPSHGAIHHQA